MLDVYLSYNTNSSWRIMFWSRGLPRKFSCLKKFSSLTDTDVVCLKGVIIQGSQLKRRFPCGSPVVLEKKWVCNWSV